MYNVTISRVDSYSCIIITRSGKRKVEHRAMEEPYVYDVDSVVAQTDSGEISQLYDFLEKYQFRCPNPQYTICIGKEYFKTTFIEDSLRLIINQDTVRREFLFWFGYFYDKDSAKVYKEITKTVYCLSESNVMGNYNSKTKSKFYEIGCSPSGDDCKLNQWMLALIRKYDTLHDHSEFFFYFQGQKPNP